MKNSLKNVNFSKLFPLKKFKHVMSVRNPLKYHVNKASTERYRKSTVPYLQRQLNRENLKRKSDFNDLQTLNKPKKRRTNNSTSELCQHCLLILSLVKIKSIIIIIIIINNPNRSENVFFHTGGFIFEGFEGALIVWGKMFI